jgi:hypothetical protein
MINNKFNPELVAPCGMNCAICKAYIACKDGIPRVRGKITYCAGCLTRPKNCYIKRGCKRLSKHQIQSCSECDTMPCEKLARLDKRYRERYDMSMVENLKLIKFKGIDEFLKSQAEKYTCPNCGDAICVHDAKCLACSFKRKS